MSDIVRGTVKQTDVTKGCQEVQLELLADETTDPDVEHYEQAGVTFRLPLDAETLCLALGGAQMNRTSLLTSGRGKRPTVALEEGEGGLYFDAVFRVFLKSDGTLRIGTKDATEAIIKGDLFKTWVDAHTHATPFGPTGAPVVLMPANTLSTIAKVT